MEFRAASRSAAGLLANTLRPRRAGLLARALSSAAPPPHERGLFRPKRIILIRHGESEGNVDEQAYTHTPDSRVPLTSRGLDQAALAGRMLHQLIGPEANVYFYVSPYTRAKQTLARVLEALPPERVIGVREDPRIAEQQFGNLQDLEEMRESKRARDAFGKFFFRFPYGESALDVYSRVTSFISTLFRDVQHMRDSEVMTNNTHIVIVAHGLTFRTFLMRWFQLSVDDFERLTNQPNASLLVMERTGDASGQQWFELTPASWALVNAAGALSQDPRVAGKPGAASHALKASYDVKFDSIAPARRRLRDSMERGSLRDSMERPMERGPGLPPGVGVGGRPLVGSRPLVPEQGPDDICHRD
jgi:broad specificity phosphatase PhoE